MIASTFAEDFCNDLNNKHNEYTFEIEPGRTYDKIVSARDSSNHRSRSVHAFVVRKTGDLVKPGSWKAPQRDKDGLAIRYNLADPEDYNRAITAADPYGAYLYK